MFPHVTISAVHTRARRERLREHLAGAAGLFVAGQPARRAVSRFRPDSDFFYLTGLTEPDAALLVAGNGEAIAFLRPRDRAAEGWDGPMLGLEDAPAALGVDAAFPISELAQRLPELLRGHDALCYQLGGRPDVDAAVVPLLGDPHGPATLVHPRALLHPLRMVKTAEEIACLQAAADVTARGFAAALNAIRPGGNERDVRAALEGTFLAHGADGPAYGTIVAGGAHATVLHYKDDDAPLRAGEVVLIDAGAEVDCYGCDVSRSYPVSGRFTPEQAAVYAWVLRAQAEALATLVPGTPVDAYHARAEAVLAQGLVALGVLAGPVEAVLAEGRHKPYTRHRAGHFLGLDTHDVGGFQVAGRSRLLEPGMVLTVEPGLYFPTDDPTLDPALAGLGVRIEDVAVITPDGASWLTEAIPRSLEAVQRPLEAVQGALEATQG